MTAEERGRKIAYFRILAGLSQKELAAKLNISAYAVSKYETGVNDIPGGSRVRYAQALNIDPQVFLRETGYIPEGFLNRRIMTKDEEKEMAEHVKEGGIDAFKNAGGRLMKQDMDIRDIRQLARNLLVLTGSPGTHDDPCLIRTELVLLTAALIYLYFFTETSFHTLILVRRLITAAQEGSDDEDPCYTPLYIIFEEFEKAEDGILAQAACEYYEAYTTAPDNIRRMTVSSLLGRLTDIRFQEDTKFWKTFFEDNGSGTEKEQDK